MMTGSGLKGNNSWFGLEDIALLEKYVRHKERPFCQHQPRVPNPKFPSAGQIPPRIEAIDSSQAALMFGGALLLDYRAKMPTRKLAYHKY